MHTCIFIYVYINAYMYMCVYIYVYIDRYSLSIHV